MLLMLAAPLRAQEHRILLALGAGSLSPDDPFTATLSFRGSAGWLLSHRNAIALDYTRQSANRSTSADLGRYARQFVGLSWQHAFRDAFFDEEHLKQQYFLNLSAGVLTRANTRDLDPVQDLNDALYFGAGVAIRYPVSSRLAALGAIEDDVGLLPKQVMKTRCNATTCYPVGSGQYYTFETPSQMQHNFGLFILVQWRP